MKVSKKITLSSLIACFVLLIALAFGLSDLNTKRALAAEATDVSHYFYSQLTDEQKEFYRAMEEMNRQGLFIKGEDYDLVANGHVTQEQLDAYAKGSSHLIKVFGAARDAFYTDYADVFYVDFSYLSLRVTQSANGYHAWMGKGRGDSYYLEGFTSEADVKTAIGKYNAAVDAVVAEVEKAEPTEAQIAALGDKLATEVAKIREAHKWIALNTVYKLENNASAGNRGHVRTPYGVFVAKSKDKYRTEQGEALCEGYSRAFTVLMDKLGVPCVLINGAYRHTDNKQELHMWAYVQLLDGKWYAVDQTFDDLNLKRPDNGVPYEQYPELAFGKAYNEDYFLKGASFMNSQHAPSPYKSEAEYPFEYPQLAPHNLGSEVSTARGGIIEVTQEPYDASMGSTNFKISVFIDEDGDGEGEWCGYQKAAKKGYYILVRYEGNYLPEELLRASGGDFSKFGDDEDIKVGNVTLNSNALLTWAYLNPIPEGIDYIKESEDGSYTILKDGSRCTGIEVAVTDMPPLRPYDKWEDNILHITEMTTYFGDPTKFIARSGLIEALYAEDKGYYPAPHVLRSTPAITGKLSIGYSYNCTVEYDQYLKLIDGDTKLQVSVVGMRATGEYLKGTNVVPISVIKNISFDPGDEQTGRFGSVSFDFTPSELYAHDNVLYIFSFNLEGVNSHQRANPVEYAAAYESQACCYPSNGYHWNVWGQPQLMENSDLSMEDWELADGTDVGELESMKDRLALVVTKPTKPQEAEMNDALSDELKAQQGEIDEGGFESFTFNISLTICKGVIITTGQGVRVCVGFPEGFTYDDSMNGVSFKAYHFMRDAQNNITGVEEIECTVTPLGLVLMCKSFSPFAIVVTKNEDTAPATEKSVVLMNSTGGTAYAEGSNMFKLKEGETRTVTVKANDGYVIESIKAGGATVEIKNQKEMEFEIAYDGISTGHQLVEVNFVSETVKAAEAERGESVIIQELKAALISVAKTASAKLGSALEIKATVTAYGDANTYQWYKDGEALTGQTSATLNIESAQMSDEGSYTLKVTSASGSASAVAISDAISVSITNSESSGGLPDVAILGITLGALAIFAVAIIVPVAIAAKKKK